MNPSDRILKIITLCANINVRENHAAINGWRKALRQPWDGEGEISDSTLASRLTIINNQIDDLETTLLGRNIPKPLFSEHLPNLRKAFSPFSTNSPWGKTIELLSPQLKTTLHWSSWAIGETEKLISIDDLQELMTSLNELDALIAEPSLPDSLRALIQKNVREIREAIELYPILGANGLKVVVNKFFGEAVFQQELWSAAKNSADNSISEACTKFFSVIKKTVDTFNTSATTVDNAIKLTTAASILKIGFSG